MKTKKEILQWLRKIESDERLHYPSACIVINAPLALEQMSMETKSDVLRTILGMPLCCHNPKGRWTVGGK